ncbi:MAG: fused MFS/spermidine synthase [Verrucomicrobia bacterium]|nr:fused MFS/spermidine synthase [Verrucomicrobiota bacterium]
MPILLLFFCSGATALIYEVVWSKYLALMFGSTIQAQTVVLAVFMGGLALGNRLFGNRADRARQPLAWYGYIEVTIGLYAFFFTSIYGLADGIYVKLGSPIVEHSGLLLVLKGVLSVALLLGPTTLMGGTLPLLAAWLQKQSTDAGRRSARFYSTNSLGAVCGAGLAGFFLVRAMGLPVTLQMTAFANVLVGFAAIGLARRQGKLTTDAARASAGSDTAPSQCAAAAFRWGCVMVTFTGAVSMGLEVLATRCLSLIFGASLQSFAIVLMAFILGIGLGSAVIASPRRRHMEKEKTCIALLLLASGLVGLLVFKMEGVVEVYRLAKTGLAASAMGFRLHEILAAAISMLVLGVPAALLGSVLPLSIRAASENTSVLGDRVGRLLTWNTLGAVAGVLLTGFVLMPRIGLRGSFGVLAIVLSVTALLVARIRRQWRTLAVGAVITGLLLLDCAFGGEGWRHVMSSGAFRKRELAVDPREMEFRRKNVEILFYEDAADATVSVEKLKNSKDIALRINGKPDASTEGDLSTQYLLAHLPMLARPDSKDVFVLGFGSGITGGALLGHPIEHLNIAENCRPVLRAGKLFEPWNHGVLTDPRTRIWPEDARTVLKLNPQKYDVIISEPSNPWVAGIGSVFSREFYELASTRLKEGGIMAQWFHVYEMNDGIVGLVLRTFGSVFPYVEIWDTNLGDIVFLGSHQPWETNPDSFRKVFARELPREDLEQIGLKTPETIWARQIASQRTGFAIPGRGPTQSDAFPVLEYEAPKAFYIGGQSRLLANFDERTWQLPFAALEKQSVLGTLPDDVLKPIFARHNTCNNDLENYLIKRFGAATGDNSPEILDSAFIPCIFRPANRLLRPTHLPKGVNEEGNRFLQARASLLSNREQWPEGIRLVEAILRAPPSNAAQPALEWPLALYAAMAAKASLSLGNVPQARELLLLGLKQDPQLDQLQYLARIMVREKLLRPEDIPVSF